MAPLKRPCTSKEEVTPASKRGRPAANKDQLETPPKPAPKRAASSKELTPGDNATKAKRGRPRKDSPPAATAAKEAKIAEPAKSAEVKAAPKRGRSKKAVDDSPAAAESNDALAALPKRGRSKQEQADADAAEKGPKRGRSKKDLSGDEAGAPSAGKRDKNAPLPRSNTPRELVAEGQRVLRVISLNVAGLRSVLNGDKAKTLLELVKRELPDVLCLNEHKLKEDDVEEWEPKLRELLPPEYGTIHWTCSTAKKGYAGVAIILRHHEKSESCPIVDAAGSIVSDGMGESYSEDPIISQEGRVLTLELPELVIVSTYVPNSGTDLSRLSYRVDRNAKECWDRSLTEYVKTLRKDKAKPVIVIGDLNCCHRVEDIWNMHERPDFPKGLAEKELQDQYTGLTALKKFAGLTPEERESFPKILAEADLVDTFRARHPTATGVFSYFSQRVVQNRPMNRGLRLDYVLASSDLCAGLRPSSEGQAADETGTAELAAAAAVATDGDLPLPRILDSFILDEDDMVADHCAVGCCVLLPPLEAATSS